MDLNTGANLAIAFTGIGTLIVAWRMMNKRQEVKIEPQPVAVAVQPPVEVRITEELHEQFASKTKFEEHVNGNTARHNQIFHRIDEVQEKMTATQERLATEMRNRDEAISKDLNEKFFSIQRLLGRIEQKIDSK